MNPVERQQTVLNLLQDLRGLEPLKELFWARLKYDRVNQPLSRRGWSNTAKNALTEDPKLWASGGDGGAFHVVYARLASDRLRLGMERPVVTTLLREHPYALFVFSNDAQDNWHFLNVKYDENSLRRQLFRRITVGPEERLRTASEQLATLDLDGLPRLSPLDIQSRHDEAFDVEAVTKRFFVVFAQLYDKVAEDIARTPGLKAEAGKLAQQLLDRMIFLYFIQKKGWLDQNPNFLHERFLECWRKDPKGHSFYPNVLYALFLCLSDADPEFESVGAVPFLNGGLFEESTKQSQAENIAQARLKVRNNTFRAIFDDMLERFNFTVTEDTPLDVEVAIDPEMLGKIFESLILQLEKDPDKDLRKLTGSYYTPRAIVHFMCQEALKEYLVTQLVGEDTAKAEAVRDKVSTLLALPPADHLDDEQTKTLKKLFSPAEAKTLRQAILNCRVCDPAVGSGAFPVGMLHEMAAAVARLDLRLDGCEVLETRNYDYDLKKRIVETCLYGVDIQEQAVRLCELRLWLSLVVDYQIDTTKPFTKAIREIPCLPNLSYRIVRGDSLLERLFGHVVQLDQLAKDAKTKQIIESIQADKQAYFHEGDTTEKRRLELKILAKQADLAERLIEAKRALVTDYQQSLFGDEGMTAKDRKAKAEQDAQVAELVDLQKKVAGAKKELERLTRQKRIINRGDLDTLRRQYFHTGSDPTFMWRVDFAEVFQVEGGFHIVIANPPYVSFGLRGNKAAKREWGVVVRRVYPGSAEYKISLYALFLDLSLSIATKHACIAYITPDSFLLGRYFSKIRRTILESAAIRKVVMFRQDFWKSGVVGRPTITVLQRASIPTSCEVVLVDNEESISKGQIKHHRYEQQYFETIPFNRFRLFFKPVAMAFVKAMETDAVPLGSLSRITTGVRSKSGQASIVSTSMTGSKWKKGIISGSQVRPFHVEWIGHYIHIDGNLLYAGGWDRDIVERPKIMIRQTGDTIIAAIDRDQKLYHLNNVHSLAPLQEDLSLPYICALLNSRMMNRYYHLISLELGRSMAQTDIETLELLPFRKPSRRIVQRIEELLSATNASTHAVTEIDELVAAVYDLGEELLLYLEQDELYPTSPGFPEGDE